MGDFCFFTPTVVTIEEYIYNNYYAGIQMSCM